MLVRRQQMSGIEGISAKAPAAGRSAATRTAFTRAGSQPELGNVVLVFQGGGALGAYQVGVYQALHEAGIEPDWVIGTSIGAINASIIAGNAVEDRLPRLQEFWRRMEHSQYIQSMASLPLIGGLVANWMTITWGIPGFFNPNPFAFAGPHIPLGAEAAGYYCTAPLAATLNELVDFSHVNRGGTRLTVGAANLRTSEMRYFDSRDMTLDARHVMASGALPPAFPPIRIDGELYWDGGILSNTPVEAIFDDNPRRSALVFVVHIWNPHGAEPDTIWQVLNRQKDVQYSSRAVSHIMRQKQLHRLRHVISELVARLPENERQCSDVRELAGYGCLTRMHVVRLLAPVIDGENHTKDVDFSPSGIRARRNAGYADTCRTIQAAPWEGAFDALEGFILHEAATGTVVTSG
jgi:NTE family protein